MKVDIECGDLILFSRPCMSMTILPAVICLCAKQTSFSTYDHIGIVIECPISMINQGNSMKCNSTPLSTTPTTNTPTPTPNVTSIASNTTTTTASTILYATSPSNDISSTHLYLLEANMGGVTLRKLDERLLKTKADHVCIRKLNGNKSEKFKEKLWAEANKVWINSM